MLSSITSPPCALKRVLLLTLKLTSSVIIVSYEAEASSCISFTHAEITGACDSAWHFNARAGD